MLVRSALSAELQSSGGRGLYLLILTVGDTLTPDAVTL